MFLSSFALVTLSGLRVLDTLPFDLVLAFSTLFLEGVFEISTAACCVLLSCAFLSSDTLPKTLFRIVDVLEILVIKLPREPATLACSSLAFSKSTSPCGGILPLRSLPVGAIGVCKK